MPGGCPPIVLASICAGLPSTCKFALRPGVVAITRPRRTTASRVAFSRIASIGSCALQDDEGHHCKAGLGRAYACAIPGWF
jgi:hypothetical protein